EPAPSSSAVVPAVGTVSPATSDVAVVEAEAILSMPPHLAQPIERSAKPAVESASAPATASAEALDALFARSFEPDSEAEALPELSEETPSGPIGYLRVLAQLGPFLLLAAVGGVARDWMLRRELHRR
ncbi:MAG: hypothetical protein ACTHK7_07760, partial [Aureliella sp.]